MKNENTEGLRYPSIDTLLSKIDSKYKLAYASSLRAKAIKEFDDLSIKVRCVKPVGQALEEIEADKVQIIFTKKS
jgi:DNA-directed RNA polymerase subunit omega